MRARTSPDPGGGAGEVLFDVAAGALRDAFVDSDEGQTRSSWSVGDPCLATWSGGKLPRHRRRAPGLREVRGRARRPGVRGKLGLDDIFVRRRLARRDGELAAVIGQVDARLLYIRHSEHDALARGALVRGDALILVDGLTV